MEKLSTNYQENVKWFDEQLGVGRSCDIVSRNFTLGGRRARVWVVDGYGKDEVLERMGAFWLGLDAAEGKRWKQMQDFVDRYVTFFEVEVSTAPVDIVTNVLLGERYKQISNEVKNYFKGEYGIAPGPVSLELQDKILGEGNQPIDCRIEDQKRTGEDFAKAKEDLGDLARTEEDIMSYICFPKQAKEFLEKRKAKEENIAVYSIEEA